MLDQGLGGWPRRRARMTPSSVALDRGGRTVTYADLERGSLALAHGLRRRGVGRGDRVAFLGLNSIELVEVLFATARLGAVFLPLNTRLAAPETAYVLTDGAPTVLIAGPGFEDLLASPPVSALGLDTVLLQADADDPLAELRPGHEGEPEPIDEPVSQEELVMIQYTSGTSGRPKGVMLTHANITWNVYNLLVDVDLTSSEVALVTAPLFHTAALNQLLLPTLLKGGTALVEERFDADRALRMIQERGVTSLFGVTSMYLALAQAPAFETADLSTLRIALGGGSPFPESLLSTYRDRGLMIIQGYGLTETSPGATMLRAADGFRKLGSAGTACFFTDVRVVTPDLTEVGVDEPGEVLVQGPNVTPGYWRNASATADAFVDGDWLRSGDVARVDDEGFVHIVDRLKDMYISGGENVYPAEVEQAAYTHPAIAECAVVGVPDERWGEVGRLVAVLRPDCAVTVEELIEHLGHELARYKIPRTVHFVDALPHNASGKLLRARVREEHGPAGAG